MQLLFIPIMIIFKDNLQKYLELKLNKLSYTSAKLKKWMRV